MFLEESEAWVTGGMDFSRTAVVTVPWAAVLQGPHSALERTSGLLALESGSSQVRFTSPRPCHRGTNKRDTCLTLSVSHFET